MVVVESPEVADRVMNQVRGQSSGVQGQLPKYQQMLSNVQNASCQDLTIKRLVGHTGSWLAGS